MPKPVTVDCEYIEYWYAKAEEKDRKGDIAYIKQNLPLPFNCLSSGFESFGWIVMFLGGIQAVKKG